MKRGQGKRWWVAGGIGFLAAVLVGCSDGGIDGTRAPATVDGTEPLSAPVPLEEGEDVVAQTEAALEEQRAISDAMTAKIEALQEQIEALQAAGQEDEDLQQELADLQKAADEATARAAELQAKLDDANKEIEGLKTAAAPTAQKPSDVLLDLVRRHIVTTAMAEGCVPSDRFAKTAYADGRAYIPLVVRVFHDTDFKGNYRDYIPDGGERDVDYMGRGQTDSGFNDRTSSVIVFKGPNYREGDKVELFHHAGYASAPKPLVPGEYSNVTSFGLNNDELSSLRLARDPMKRGACAEEADIRDPNRFAGPIPLVIEASINPRREFPVAWLIESKNKLDNLYFGDDIESFRLVKGPDYGAYRKVQVTFWKSDGNIGKHGTIIAGDDTLNVVHELKDLWEGALNDEIDSIQIEMEK